MKYLSVRVPLVFALIVSLCGVNQLSAKEAGEPEVLKKEEEIAVSKVARIAGINHSNRRVILEDELGRQQTVVLSDDVQRLDEFELGDKIEIDYYMSFAVEVREPTEAELATPFIDDQVMGRNSEEFEPAGGKMRTVKAVCTVEGLDRPSETITLKGPEGNLRVIRVRDVENLTKLRIGDTLIVTFTEAIAMRVEKLAEE